ncbi:MAG: metallophosphoesterase, partial [Anaerolineae bacterium]|nr:metallophosphoesterase [Anaerolineae bacterium]
MRLAVLSDIHGNLRALQAVLADLEAAGGTDRIWILGDLVAFCPEPVECLQAIRALPEATTEVIQGNTDRYIVTGARPTWPPQTEETWQDVLGLLRERDMNFGWTTERLGWTEAEYLIKLPTDLSLEVDGYGWVIGFHAAPGDDELVLLPGTAEE